MAKVTTITKSIITRDWNDLEPKVVTFLASGLTVSGIITVGGYLGLHLTAPEASLAVVLISSIAAYIKKSSQTLPEPVVAPKPIPAPALAAVAPVKVAPPTTTMPAVVTPPATLAQQVTQLATPPVPPVTS